MATKYAQYEVHIPAFDHNGSPTLSSLIETTRSELSAQFAQVYGPCDFAHDMKDMGACWGFFVCVDVDTKARLTFMQGYRVILAARFNVPVIDIYVSGIDLV